VKKTKAAKPPQKALKGVATAEDCEAAAKDASTTKGSGAAMEGVVR